MRRLLIFLSLLALVLLLPGMALAQGGEFVHIVAAGETLEGIALRYGIDPFALAARNGISNFASIYVGQPLVVPVPVNQGGGVVPPVTQPSSFLYIVQPGDYLSVLALRFGTTTAAIAAANGISNVNRILAGQTLLIPAPGDQGGGIPPVPQPQPVFYTVQFGDTLGTIARQFGTSVAALAAENNITNINRIFFGQVLRIPDQGGGTPPPPPFFTYVVRPGDTLNEIAFRFGTTLQALLTLNPQIRDPRLIYPGSLLTVPLG
jgi:LysM repeat protein